MNAGPILVTLARGETLALGVNDRGFALANRNLALTGAASYAERKNCRAEENQDFFHGDATRVYPINDPRCTDRTSSQLVRKSHTAHNCAAFGQFYSSRQSAISPDFTGFFMPSAAPHKVRTGVAPSTFIGKSRTCGASGAESLRKKSALSGIPRSCRPADKGPGVS
jgi:hypothetical protein